MDFFTLFTPDGLELSIEVVCIIIAIMFLYTFIGICAGFGGALVTMPLITLLLPVKMAAPMSVIVGQPLRYMPPGCHVTKPTGDLRWCLSCSPLPAFPWGFMRSPVSRTTS